MGELRLVGKLEGKGPLGRDRSRWEDVRMDLTEIGWDGVDWIHLVKIGVRGGLPNWWRFPD
jgi:hypothetical protein